MFHKENVRRFVFEQSHPISPYNDQHMKNIFTELIHIAEETLYQRVSKKYNHHNLIFLSLEESKRNLLNLACQNINKLIKSLMNPVLMNFIFSTKE